MAAILAAMLLLGGIQWQTRLLLNTIFNPAPRLLREPWFQEGATIMAGPYVYPNPHSLVGHGYVADVANNNLGECVSLVKHFIPELQNRSTQTWVEGRNVIETLENGESILEGTAIATFVNGRFISGHGHAAFYAGWIHDTNSSPSTRILIVEQFRGDRPTNGIVKRLLPNYGKKPDGTWDRRSNNGRAFSVIL
jgi:hypothetical protein